MREKVPVLSCKRHVLLQKKSVWTSHVLLHDEVSKEAENQHHDVLTKMNRLEGQNLDTIRPVLASGAVFVFIFTFQFYRYCKFLLN